jgi:hypothetical protein
MAARRGGCAAVALDEHRIMVAGGSSDRCSGQVLNTTEVLDIRTMAFAPGPSMGSERYGCAAVPIDAQHVLVISGYNSGYQVLNTTEIFDVLMMEFSPGPAMQDGRNSIAAARLETAQGPRIIRIAGGTTFSSTTEVLAFEDLTAA